jgi:riboflavin biosynthesis pyrimidine reductase
MERPKVVVIQEASLDGKLAVSSDQPLLFGDERWDYIRIGKSHDILKSLMMEMSVQATLEGSNSFIRAFDKPEILPPIKSNVSNLYKDYLPKEILNRRDHRGWFIAADGKGRVRWMYKDGYPGDDFWDGWRLLVLVSNGTPAEYLSYLQNESIPYLVSGVERIDFKEAFEKIKIKLGVETIMSTAGGELNGHLLKSGLVDEINIEFLPGIIGGGENPSLFSGYSLSNEESPITLDLISFSAQTGGRIWVRYKVNQP